MTIANDFIMQTAYVALFVLLCAVFLTFIRLMLGPSLADRVVALDLIATLLVALIAAYAITTREPILLRVAMVVALFNFIGTIAFAYYLQLRGHE